MDYKQPERLLKALANRRRLHILSVLRTRGGTTVGGLAEELNIPMKTTSKHLAILLLVDLVDRKQTGSSAQYTLLEPLHPYTKTVLANLRG